MREDVLQWGGVRSSGGLKSAFVISMAIHVVAGLSVMPIAAPSASSADHSPRALSAVLLPAPSSDLLAAGSSVSKPQRQGAPPVRVEKTPFEKTPIPVAAPEAVSLAAFDAGPVGPVAQADASPLTGQQQGETPLQHEVVSVVRDAPENPDGIDVWQQFQMDIMREARQLRRYPAVARERGWEGTVDVLVSIAPALALPKASLGKTSGYGLLDEEAVTMVAAAVQRVRLPDAMRNRMAHVSVPVRYRLDE